MSVRCFSSISTSTIFRVGMEEPLGITVSNPSSVFIQMSWGSKSMKSSFCSSFGATPDQHAH